MIGAFVFGVLAICALLLWLASEDKVARGARRPNLPTMPRTDADTGDRPAPAHAAENDFATVQCTVQAAPNMPVGRILAHAVDVEGTEPGTVLISTSRETDLIVTLDPGRWTLLWSLGDLPSGFHIGTVDLVEGEVFTCALSPTGVPVSGRVVDPKGEPLPDTRVEGCGPSVQSDADGRFQFVVPFGLLRGLGRTCTLRARFEDGLLSRYSQPSKASALRPGPHILTLDPSPVAGMGITLRQVEDGIQVSRVHPGTPAEDADLRAGDLILSVDGHSTEGMKTHDFIPYGVGVEGTTVVLEIERDGQSLRKSFRRERIVKLGDTGGR